METEKIYANIFATMTTKLSNMKAAGLIHDYDVDCVIRDWNDEGAEDEKDYNYIKIRVNQFGWNMEKPSIEFNGENQYSAGVYEEFNNTLDGIIRSALDDAKSKLDEAQTEFDRLNSINKAKEE